MATLPRPTVRPCNGCPWRRQSAPGWLGPLTAGEWVELVHSDEAIACHETIEEEGRWDTPRIRQCAGAASYRANVAKCPRDPEVAVGPVDREGVFAAPFQFVDHHTGRVPR